MVNKVLGLIYHGMNGQYLPPNTFYIVVLCSSWLRRKHLSPPVNEFLRSFTTLTIVLSLLVVSPKTSLSATLFKLQFLAPLIDSYLKDHRTHFLHVFFNEVLKYNRKPITHVLFIGLFSLC